jgi:hypothetical protein
MSVQAQINPHYKQVKPEADAYMARLVLSRFQLSQWSQLLTRWLLNPVELFG